MVKVIVKNSGLRVRLKRDTEKFFVSTTKLVRLETWLKEKEESVRKTLSGTKPNSRLRDVRLISRMSKLLK